MEIVARADSISQKGGQEFALFSLLPKQEGESKTSSQESSKESKESKDTGRLEPQKEQEREQAQSGTESDQSKTESQKSKTESQQSQTDTTGKWGFAAFGDSSSHKCELYAIVNTGMILHLAAKFFSEPPSHVGEARFFHFRGRGEYQFKSDRCSGI